MRWSVQFEGRQLPLDAVWDDIKAIAGPLKNTVEAALDKAADPAELADLNVVIFAEDNSGGAEWGFKLEGPPVAVNYAISLIGTIAPIVPNSH